MPTQSQESTQKITNSSTHGGRQKIRVFLEGREVPVTSAAVVFRMNMPAMANIELVPLNVIKFIKPRTQVHIFVRDARTFGDNNFYLCFEGEVMGRTMVKKHNGASLFVQCEVFFMSITIANPAIEHSYSAS